MLGRRPPSVYIFYLLLAVLQPVVLVLDGDLAFQARGLLILAPLLLALAYGSRLAWALLLVLDGLPLLATAAVAVTTAPWAWSSGTALTGVMLLATLTSSPMRRHLDHRRLQSAPGPTPLPQ
jgi:hypothetical protein